MTKCLHKWNNHQVIFLGSFQKMLDFLFTVNCNTIKLIIIKITYITCRMKQRMVITSLYKSDFSYTCTLKVVPTSPCINMLTCMCMLQILHTTLHRFFMVQCTLCVGRICLKINILSLHGDHFSYSHNLCTNASSQPVVAAGV